MLKKVIYQDLRNIFQNGIASVVPEKLISQNVFVENYDTVMICDKSYSTANGCYVIGFGKAVFGMAVTLEKLLGKQLRGGIISVPVGILDTFKKKKNYKPVDNSRIIVLEGAVNNLPDQLAESNAKEIIKFIDQLSEEALLIVLISGGGSALFPVPKAPLKLSEKTQVIKYLMEAGATINELNLVRKQISEVKGGGLAEIACPRHVVSLIISDVIGNAIDLIASGPTIRNRDKLTEVKRVFDKYKLETKLVSPVYNSIFSRYNNRLVRDSDQAFNEYDFVDNFVIGSNDIALSKACNLANSLEYAGCVMSGSVQGNVELLSAQYVKLVRMLIELLLGSTLLKGEFMNKLGKIIEGKGGECFGTVKPEAKMNMYKAVVKVKKEGAKGICILMGGEPTVVVAGRGVGGRNQQLALQFSVDMSNYQSETSDLHAVLLCAGTDGIDGPTDAAGAIGFGEQCQQGLENRMNPATYLANNDAYTYYSNVYKGKYLIKTGHTGTNVMDMHILIIAYNK